jgi:hypothetical protein
MAQILREDKGKRIPIGWTGTQLETIGDDDLWRELEIKTQEGEFS